MREADAGQILERILVTLEARIENGQRPRPGWAGSMMIGDDQIEAEAARMRSLAPGADPAVDRDHKPGALRLQGTQGFGVKAISFVEAIGDVGPYPGAQPFANAHQERGRGDAVSVVISIHDDRLLVADRGPNALPGRGHPAQEKWIAVFGFAR